MIYLSNIFLKNNRVKIGDLGISICKNKIDDMKVKVGAACYMAPEIVSTMIIRNSTFKPDFPSDLW